MIGNNLDIKQKAMRKYIYSLISFFLLSCSNDNSDTDQIENPSESGVTCTIPALEFDDDLQTRSTITFDFTKEIFHSTWANGDKITVYSDENNYGVFSLVGEGGTNSSKFTGGGFDLKQGSTYYSLGQSSATLPSIASDANYKQFFVLDNPTNMKLSYDGQNQTENKSTAHLGKYDYLATSATASSENVASFTYTHLGYELYMIIKAPTDDNDFKNTTFTEAIVYEAGANEYRQPNRSINISNTTLKWNDADLSGNNSYRFKLNLGTRNDDSGKYNGFTPDSDGNLHLFMFLPPYDLTGKTLVIRLNGTYNNESKPYYITFKGSKAWNMNTAHIIEKNAIASTKFNIKVQIMEDWAKGNTFTDCKTRATGDPGNTESFTRPNYLYAFLINDGHLVQVATASNIGSLWSEDAKGIYTYTGTWTKTTNSGSGNVTEQNTDLALDSKTTTNAKVFIIGSKTELSIPSYSIGTTSGSSEEIIKGFTYNYPENDAQEFIKNLYSTPYSDTDFSGSLTSGDDFKTVRLYHVASKFDINWESSTALTPGEEAVKVTNFPTTGLKYFLPTSNTAVTTGTVILTAPITTGTAYNGRAYWYVPQPNDAKYYVTFGSGEAQSISFTKDDTYASWFRALITK